MAFEAESPQALAGVLVGEVEALLQVFGRRLPQPQLLRGLLVEEAHLLQWGGRGVRGQGAGLEEGGANGQGAMVRGTGQWMGAEPMGKELWVSGWG